MKTSELTDLIRELERILAPVSESELWQDYCEDIRQQTGQLPYEDGDTIVPDRVSDYWLAKYQTASKDHEERIITITLWYDDTDPNNPGYVARSEKPQPWSGEDVPLDAETEEDAIAETEEHFGLRLRLEDAEKDYDGALVWDEPPPGRWYAIQSWGDGGGLYPMPEHGPFDGRAAVDQEMRDWRKRAGWEAGMIENCHSIRVAGPFARRSEAEDAI